MSSWRLVVRELYESPKPTMRRVQFAYQGARVDLAIMKAKARGLIASEPLGVGRAHVYSLTRLGVLLATNRIVFAPKSWLAGNGRPVGTGLRAKPTWLSALPLCNEIRIT